MVTIEGKYGIRATILADSISKAGVRFLTYEIEYPRLILAELNTHRALSKNSFSSRAVPFLKMLKQLLGRPFRFGANQGGMQDKGEDFKAGVLGWPQEHDGNSGAPLWTPEEAWDEAKDHAVYFAKQYADAGYHKQVYNRLLEPFQMMKTVLSGTELENFFWLRDHKAADPTLAELARVMNEARKASTPQVLGDGEWHLPYVDCAREDNGDWSYSITTGEEGKWQSRKYLSVEEAIKVSCARCAAVSYRNEGYDLTKSLEVYDRLVGDDRKHASAFEHQATPIRPYGMYEGLYGPFTQNNLWVPMTWEEGVTHVDRNGNLWSGNLKGWKQYRKLIKGENYTGE